MSRRTPEEYESLEPLTDLPEKCKVRPGGKNTPECGRQIMSMSYKGTDACGELHLKILTNDHGTGGKQVGRNS